MTKLKLATVFSGIGAVEHALDRIQASYEVVFACDNGERILEETEEEILKQLKENELSTNSEINNYITNLYTKKGKNFVQKTYEENYKLTGEFYQDIRFVNGHEYRNKVDLFVGGSPCQAFSILGKRKGLEDTRGTLFYHYARLVKEIQPTYFIFENVPGILNHDKGKTWDKIYEVFKSLNYDIEYSILNAADYGLPQTRKRLFVIGTKNRDFKIDFPKVMPLKQTVKELLLEINGHIDKKYYLPKKGFLHTTTEDLRNGRVSINEQTVMRCQVANQQFNWNGSFIFEEVDQVRFQEGDLIDNRIYVGKYMEKLGVIRKLTPKEVFRCMGFINFKFNIEVPDTKLYRQCGNSIAVDTLIALLNKMNEQTGWWDNE